MFSLILVVTLQRFNPVLAAAVVVLAFGAALFLYLRYTGSLPRWIMDILDRFTDRAILERAYAERSSRRSVIDADILYQTLRAKVVGQDAALRSIAVQLRRRLLARRPDKPVAVFCLAGPSGVGKTHLAKVLGSKPNQLLAVSRQP